ncbi:THxN family PEP-CTERM protein [Lamprobacter modestohalophilus]|uniref:THxN family PEP-CTERM protein n=1 Tax=Lamprobacter modestohalophilus TaxID=1064514 RepID=UPI002ADEF597|nr:THxN family PEP-CTERM protein [Lamprobacter modestohalophilus]MEA1050933.1 THxN family PEP-CTERM protein [Lamprobacter modestohalophilus]
MMNFRLSKPLTHASVALLLGVSATSVSAGPIVTEWSYSTNATFSDASFTGSDGVITATDSELSWGSGTYCTGLVFFGTCIGGTADPDFQNPTNDASNNRSALTIGSGPDGTLTGGGPATGSVNTVLDNDFGPGDFALGTNITHWNNPITSNYDTLLGARITDTLTLTPVLPSAGLPQSAPTVTFDFLFRETPNAGACAGGEANPCPDLFGFVAIPLLDLSFNYDDNEYFVSVLLTDGAGGAAPISTLHDEECTDLGLDAGCQGFRTLEEAATTAQFAFTISADPLFDDNEVPVPAPLALLGVGFVAMGLARRSQKRPVA